MLLNDGFIDLAVVTATSKCVSVLYGKGNGEFTHFETIGENLSPALVSHALRNYDQQAAGKQTFPLFIVPQVVMDASLERREPIEWIQIHRMPEHVQFQHRAHIRAGFECGECHGKVEEMDKVYLVEDTIRWPWGLPQRVSPTS